MGIPFKSLPPSIQDQITARYGDLMGSNGKKTKVARAPDRIEKSGKQSPYAYKLGELLQQHFPSQFIAEYHPFPKRRRFRIDYADPLLKIGIEFDGYRYHGLSKNGFKTGLVRQNLLVMDGWRVLRYTLTDVRDHESIIIEQIKESLAASPFNGSP